MKKWKDKNSQFPAIPNHPKYTNLPGNSESITPQSQKTAFLEQKQGHMGTGQRRI